MKLQKLVYYSQVWSIVWDDDTLFNEPIEAWKNGPVVRDLWESARGRFRISEIAAGSSAGLSEAQKETIDLVLEFYGDKDAQWLSDLTHMEYPWKEAYGRGQNSIVDLAVVADYYSSLSPDDAVTAP
ncbi:putative phage-associated protein [Chelatococcus caeni]|uniref:Putative phage-associated protein n=1 Tax=Chelatococcus caeni TaxID=1348468 RepID=A0A840BRY0_9HYPH|nr:type II toxin-antitoxin system antitoxin SocA domain-containing protein [Chelatococcus caeni]MBB4015514.1 putative phage-associated protein [Chelatococcus caeni]